jgi:hypothetical protein
MAFGVLGLIPPAVNETDVRSADQLRGLIRPDKDLVSGSLTGGQWNYGHHHGQKQDQTGFVLHLSLLSTL